MTTIRADIPDLRIFEPRVYEDGRGFFFESYNESLFRQVLGFAPVFVQDNHSFSTKGVLRGLHYQLSPRAQGKLVRVVSGEVFDVAVDLRPGSATFGQWAGSLLSAANRHVQWVPPGFAHGFYTLSDTADVLYKTTEFYDPASERCLAWNDPTVGVEWPLLPGLPPILSDKDARGRSLADLTEELERS